MTLDPHEETWLHAGLESLLTAEPPMLVPVGDDVRRGALALAAARRRRTAALSVAALVLAVGVPSALMLRTAPTGSEPSGGVASGTTAQPGPTPSATTVVGVLEGAGWTVLSSGTGDPQATGAVGVQMLYELRRPTGVASVVVTVYEAGQATADVLASCTASTCSPAYVGTSLVGPGGFRDDSRLVTQGPDLPAGSLVVDRIFDSGTTVEVGVGLVKPFPGAPTTPGLALTPDEVLALLAVVGDPYAGPAAQASLAAAAAASASATAQAAVDAELARRHPCRAADLQVTLDSRDGAGGTSFYWYAFRNTSRTACGLTGHPTLAADGGRVLPFTVRYGVPQGPLPGVPNSTAAVLVEPGAHALSLVSSFRCDVGEAGAVANLVVTVPGDQTPLLLPSSRQPVCVGGRAAPGNEIDVSVFYRPTS
ncbi:MAG TPA: DUF4232 domain-containing protein [Candidatus Angelobacter sp.]|nr:DUF4232 domain-containing protein [Candidatus Angelobacter sp.]